MIELARAVIRNSRTTLRPHPAWVVLVLLALFTMPGSGSESDAGDALIPLVNAGDASAQSFREAMGRIESGDLHQGLRRLQALHEATWGKNHLVLDPELIPNDDWLVAISLSGLIADEIRNLKPEAAEIYRQQFSERAKSMLARVRQGADPSGFLKVAELYPICDTEPHALLSAGDIFFETDELNRAEMAWALLDSGSKSNPELEEAVLLRRWLLASRRGDLTQANKLRRKLNASGLELPEETIFAAVEAREENSLPQLPFLSGELAWRSHDYRRYSVIFRRAGYRGGEEIRYSSVPSLGDGWVAVPTSRKLLFYDLYGGKLVEDINLRPGAPHFEETDASVRFDSVSKGGVVVTSYVARATKPDDYLGFDIQVALPQRALKAVDVNRSGRVIWDTASRRHSDPSLLRMSFNSKPLIRGERIFALGWTRSGYIDVQLVCLDLHTGEMVWLTPLVGNQVELTMFGEPAREPFLGQIAEKDGILYCCTNLGVVAAVRSWDGQVEWLTEYESASTRAYRGRWRSRQSRRVWAQNPVVIHGGLVFATPLDTPELWSFDVETGRLFQRVQSRFGTFMLGILGDRLVFAGDSIDTLPFRDLENSRLWRSYRVPMAVEGRPALVNGGVLYASSDPLQPSLYYQPLDRGRRGAAPPVEIAPLDDRHDSTGDPSRSRLFYPGNSTIAGGRVEVVGDRVLVTSSQRVTCIVAKPEKGPGEEPK